MVRFVGQRHGAQAVGTVICRNRIARLGIGIGIGLAEP
jgi:hypothetical protein